MRKFISMILAIMLFFGISSQNQNVNANDTIDAIASSCQESNPILKAVVIIEGILLLGCGMYIGYQCWKKNTKYNKVVRVRQNLSRRTGDISPLPLIEKILKYDVLRALDGETINTADMYCIFDLTLDRLNFYTQTPRVKSAKKELAGYKSTFDLMCTGECTITIKQFVDMLKNIRDMY